MNDFYNNFIDSAEKSIADSKGPNSFKLKEGTSPLFVNKEETTLRLRTMLHRTVENLDDELTRFEKNFSSKNSTVFWASSYDDVFSNLKKIFKSQKVRSVRLPNVNTSTVFRELGMKYFLREEKIELREEGDIQFFAADMMLSDIGALLLINQSNSGYALLSNHKTNVFFVTIDRIMCNSDWAEVYQQLATYSTGGNCQEMIFFKGSPNCNNYVFIVDNQRSVLLKEKEPRQALTCLQCGRCNDVCPVFQTIGEEPYNNVFSGPVANITLPYLETFESYMHVAYACTLCGRCEEVCPLSLPIRDMIIDSRQNFLAHDILAKRERRMLSLQRKVLLSRSKMNASTFVKGYRFGKYLSSDVRKSRRIPSFSKESFNKYYLKHKNKDV